MSSGNQLTPENLDFWLKNNFNVLLEGAQGIGKTALILDCFKRNSIPYFYCSAATIDPWVDFIGIPKEVKDADGESHIKLIRPEYFKGDGIQAIVVDEFNRAHKKVRNAIMELIQFKSINGHKFKNLRVVWAAINPADDEGTFDVDKLDPAQQDRFHIYIKVPNKPDLNFFTQQFADTGKAAVEWWFQQKDTIRNKISPRRLEYTLQVYMKGGDVNWALPEGVNTASLLRALGGRNLVKQIEEAFKKRHLEPALTDSVIRQSDFMETFSGAYGSNTEMAGYFLQKLPEEKRLGLCLHSDGACDFIANHIYDEDYAKLVEKVYQSASRANREAAGITITPASINKLGKALADYQRFEIERQRKAAEDMRKVAAAEKMAAGTRKSRNVSEQVAHKLISDIGMYFSNDVTLANNLSAVWAAVVRTPLGADLRKDQALTLLKMISHALAMTDDLHCQLSSGDTKFLRENFFPKVYNACIGQVGNKPTYRNLNSFVDAADLSVTAQFLGAV